jgi:tRNA nucleotidyltransferase (CCA-adding enzyme)
VAEVLRNLPEPAAALTRGVVDAADQTGELLYLVGGPVRDLLLGRALRDVDLLIEGVDGEGADALARRAAPADARVVGHDRFGTVTIETAETAIDLATTRSETYAHDGALPTVAAGTLEEDLRRRDFTVNALALPLSQAARSRRSGIVDLDGGLADLERKKLRVLHGRSFHDDPTRALRAARLAPRLGFTLSRGSRSALRDALRDGAFGDVSGDRLRREMIKLFSDAGGGLDPVRALRLLSDWHVLGAFEPGLGLPAAAVPILRRVGRAVESPPWRVVRWRPWVTGLGVWLAEVPPQMRRRTLQRFSVRGGLSKRIAGFAKTRDRTLRALGKARGRGAIDALLRDLAEEELHAMHAWAAPALRRRIVRYADEDRHRRLPVTGADITELGLSGPAIGRALERIRAAYLDGTIRSREEALALAREVARPGRSGRRRASSPRAPEA